MTGNMRERSSNHWELRWYIGLDPITRAKRYETKTVVGSYETAKNELNKVMESLENDSAGGDSDMLVGDYLKGWLKDFMAGSLARTTYARYEEILTLNLIPGLGKIPLKALNPLQIQHYYSEELAHGRRSRIGGLSKRTVLSFHRLLHCALEKAVDLELISKNPADKVTPPRPDDFSPTVFDSKKLAKLIESLKGSRYEVPCVLAATTGMRRGEVMGLQWQDVDFENKELHVQHSLEETKKGIRLKDTKTKGSHRVIPLGEIALSTLHEEQQRQNEMKKLLGEKYPESKFVCVEKDGSVISPKRLSSWYTRFLKNVGLGHARMHDLRHSGATVLLNANVPAPIVSRYLGHTSIQTTVDLYGHIMSNGSRTGVEKVDQQIREIMNQNKY